MMEYKDEAFVPKVQKIKAIIRYTDEVKVTK